MIDSSDVSPRAEPPQPPPSPESPAAVDGAEVGEGEGLGVGAGVGTGSRYLSLAASAAPWSSARVDPATKATGNVIESPGPTTKGPVEICVAKFRPPPPPSKPGVVTIASSSESLISESGDMFIAAL